MKKIVFFSNHCYFNGKMETESLQKEFYGIHVK